MKKKITTILAFVLMLSLLASCAPGGDSTTTPASNNTGTTAQTTKTEEPKNGELTVNEKGVTPPGTFPVVLEPMTVTFLAPQATLIEDIYTNDFTLEYEKMTNIHIEWDLLASGDAGDQRKLSFVSGDYPDAYLGLGITYDEEMQYGHTLFIPLNDLIDEYSVHLKALMSELKYLTPMMTAPDGSIFTMPITTYEDSHLIAPNRYWINTEWLKNLGLEAPTTTEELITVLTAFKNDDPNGNGLKDEIPLILSEPGTVYGDPSYFISAFIYDDGDNRFRILDGNIVDPVFNKEEWREGLRFLNRLYTEGLTDTTAFTLDGTAMRELVENADANLVGMVPGLYMGNFANLDGERQANYDALVPLKGPEGVQTTFSNPYVHSTGLFAITTACENPDALVRWADWFFSFEGGMRARTGIEGQHWARVTDGSLSYAGLPATWERLGTFGLAQNYCWSGLSFPQNHSFHGELKGKADKLYEADGLEDRLIVYTRQYEPYTPEKVLPPFYLDPEVSSEFYKLRTDIKKYVKEMYVQFAIGNASLDSDWDSYLAQLDAIGLQRYVELTQKGYNDFVNANP